MSKSRILVVITAVICVAIASQNAAWAAGSDEGTKAAEPNSVKPKIFLFVPFLPPIVSPPNVKEPL